MVLGEKLFVFGMGLVVATAGAMAIVPFGSDVFGGLAGILVGELLMGLALLLAGWNHLAKLGTAEAAGSKSGQPVEQPEPIDHEKIRGIEVPEGRLALLQAEDAIVSAGVELVMASLGSPQPENSGKYGNRTGVNWDRREAECRSWA